jgi:hypothetical protein
LNWACGLSKQETFATLRQRIHVPFEPPHGINADNFFRVGDEDFRKQQTSIQGINRMSRPQKIHPPIKASFTDIINAVADGRGVKIQARSASRPKNIMKASEPPPKKP